MILSTLEDYRNRLNKIIQEHVCHITNIQQVAIAIATLLLHGVSTGLP